ncbi:hypothetical protein BS50DRAFT_283155 [Corynespora cassiicola Philippines]|uniref:Uncharacterized protein n=1 Tax=Corynespora cassiicola Philippines TaxID=1448308 RepID=A0A2T2P177_CORCC|nr:hypothetical protein BS50DRAFT_283155 [Corynespora cassiicola Philippines]
MLFHSALLGGLLLSGSVSAKPNRQVDARLERSEDVEDVLRRDAEMVATLTRRQDANPAAPAPQISTTPQSGDAALADLAKWEEDTRAACGTALRTLNGQASNPTGLAVCYNLPFLDNQTGVFQAELRMYNISAPIDPWAGVTAGEVSMTLSYLGATVQSMNASTKRDIGYPPIRDGMLVERQAQNDGQLKVLNYVGKINDNLMGSAMTEETLQPLLVPQIELTARNPRTNQDVSATLSSQEASFVNGVFAKQADRTIDAAAATSASAAAAAVSEFVLPGTVLAFFPTGLVVTCVWTAGFIMAVGLGTMGRIQFRDQYRRRVRAELSRGVRTI